MTVIRYNGLSWQVPWSGVITNHSTSPFAEDMYERIKDSLMEYEVVISRWPQYTLILENVSYKVTSLQLTEFTKTNLASLFFMYF